MWNCPVRENTIKTGEKKNVEKQQDLHSWRKSPGLPLASGRQHKKQEGREALHRAYPLHLRHFQQKRNDQALEGRRVYSARLGELLEGRHILLRSRRELLGTLQPANYLQQGREACLHWLPLAPGRRNGWKRRGSCPWDSGEVLCMSERQKNKILAVYLILTTAGVKVSDSLKKAVQDIEKEQAARIISRAWWEAKTCRKNFQ